MQIASNKTLKPTKMTTFQNDICARFTYQGLELTMYWGGATRGNKSRIDYRLILNGVTLMEGNDFCTPSYPDSVEAVVELLGFLTVQPGDTDPEYFKDHSEAMLDWLYTPECDELKMYVSDYEMKVVDAYGVPFAQNFFSAYTEIMP